MSAPFDLVLIPLSIAGLLVAMAVVRASGARLGLSAELQRKLVHVATGLYALTLPFTFSSRAAVMALLCVSLCILLALRLPRFARAGFASSLHGVKRRSHGEIYLIFAVGFLYWFSAGNLALYVLPLLVLTLADAAAALAGTTYGRRHFSVAQGSKSWEGVAMFFMVTLILSMMTLLLLTDIGRGRVIVLSFLIAGFGALVEADSWGGRDNLFVPVGLHLLLATHVTTPLPELLAIAVAFSALLVAAPPLGAALGLTAHSTRASLVLIALMLAVTAPHNALIPVVAVFAHLAARARAPGEDGFPDLDMIAVAAAVGMGWLFAGQASGANALDVYNLTFAGMAALFVALAAQYETVMRRLVAAAASLAALSGLMAWIAALNAPRQSWHGDLSFWTLASLAFCVGAGWLAPEWFGRRRALRVACVAGVVPLILFCVKGMLR